MTDVEKLPSPTVDSASYEVETRTNSTAWGRFIDGFKPARLPNTTGLTEAEARAFLIDHSPLKRDLKARHITMIAVGGSIGSGLFIGSGGSFAVGGPAGVIISFVVTGIMVFCTMQSLGELSVRFPIRGSFYVHSSRFIDPSWGFALGWNYAIQWLVTYPLELIAGAIALSYWDDDNNGATNVNKAAWVALFFFVISAINVFGVRGYGEAEFIFSSIKVIAVVGFCIFGIVIAAGGGPNHKHYGAKTWHDPGAFANGFKGVVAALINAAFAFSGSEFAGIAAAETSNPAKQLPRAVKQVFWRILLFYVVSFIIISFLIRYDDPRLNSTSDGRASPFVIAIANAGVKGLPSVYNVVIVLATLSVANSSVYGCSRTLAALANEGHAPKIIGFIDREGRPMVAILINLVFGLLAFLAATPKYTEVFNWLLAFGGLSTLFAWGSACLAHVRYRAGLKYHGVDTDELVFTALGGVWTSMLGFVLNVVVLGLQFWIALFPVGGKPDAEAFFELYLSAPVALVFYIGHKLWYRGPLYVKAKDMDVFTGTRNEQLEESRLEAMEERARIRRQNILVRTWKLWC